MSSKDARHTLMLKLHDPKRDSTMPEFFYINEEGATAVPPEPGFEKTVTVYVRNDLATLGGASVALAMQTIEQLERERDEAREEAEKFRDHSARFSNHVQRFKWETPTQ